MDDEVHIGKFSGESDAAPDELQGFEMDASGDKQGDFYSKAQWFVDLYDEDYAVDQWGNEWEGETY